MEFQTTYSSIYKREENSMKALLLDGSIQNDGTAERVRNALTTRLISDGWQVQHVLLREKKIGNCAGDFFCWIRKPGMCNVDDDNRTIAEAVLASDLMVYLTPVTFGGYSSALKRMVDHQIQNILPFFAQVAGETHHQKRYGKYPDFLAIGWMEQKNEQSEALFKQLAVRNALNFYAKKSASGVIIAGQSDMEISTSLQNWLDNLSSGRASAPTHIPDRHDTGILSETKTATPIQRALLLVGSPRTRKSSSFALGGYLFDHLSARGIQTETIQLHTVLRSAEKMDVLLQEVEAADLVLLAFPLYVDSLPAPVIEALERIAAARALRGQPAKNRPQLFSAIANCGFPEAQHNATALAICETFARQSGFLWAGSLALGAGEGLVHGAPLRDAGGPAIPIKKALEMAAEKLAEGQSIPQSAVTLMAKPIIPGWIYRLMGGFGWKQQAKRYGADKSLKKQPYPREITS
jgi:multimeric flavodoxin WrbA